MKEQAENTNKGMALTLTVVYHGLLFLFIFFMVFKTPIPPYPEVGGGSGLEVNFGNSETGYGDNLSEELFPVETQNISDDKSDNFITQDGEENPEIASKNVKAKTTTQIVINDPVINPNALYKQKSKNNANQGIAGGTGNQGKLNGNVNSNNYTGDGGSGGGTGGGTGTGTGPGNGPGTSVNLSDRKTLYLPKPVYNSDDEGKVVVAITVDKSGNVAKAVAGAKGTTLVDKTIWKQSEQAALKAKFNSKSDAAVEQKGTITYIYIKLN
jgi:hypothetical protein